MVSGAMRFGRRDAPPGAGRSDSRRESRAPASARACSAPKRCWRGTSASPWWWYSMSRSSRSGERPTSWCGPRTRQVPSRARNSRTASISVRCGHLLGDDVVEPEHEQRVGVGEHALVERQREAGLVDPLEHGHGVPGDLARRAPGTAPTPRRTARASRRSPAGTARVRPLRRLVGGPEHAPDLGHRREAVVELGADRGWPRRIAPGDVDADPPPALRVFPRRVVLVVGPRGRRFAHGAPYCICSSISASAALIFSAFLISSLVT